jgi:nucleoside-diphosphate-sugar epimerase
LLDLVHIDDVIEAFMCAGRAILQQESGRKCYGVSTGHPVRLKDLVQLYEQVAGVRLPIQWGLRAYRDREVMVPWANCERVPGWKPKVGVAEGLRSLLSGANGD